MLTRWKSELDGRSERTQYISRKYIANNILLHNRLHSFSNQCNSPYTNTYVIVHLHLILNRPSTCNTHIITLSLTTNDN